MIIPEECSKDVEPVVPMAADQKRLNAQTGYRVSNVANFRDFGGLPIANSNKKVKERMIFRSAAPTYASEQDKEVLLDKLDIVTLVDFRTTYETKHLNFGRPKYEDNFLTFSAKVENGDDIDTIDRSKEQIIMEQQSFSGLKRLYKGTPRVGPRRRSFSGVTRKRYSIPLINSTFFFDGVLPQAPLSTKLKCSAVRYILRSDKVGAYVLLRHLNSMGLYEMYRLTVEHTKREILAIFNVFKNPDNYPISFFCALGKDRTGIISALLLSCLGVDRETILDNYHETEEHLAPTIEKIKAYFDKVGLTNDEFIQAPKHIMRNLLAYIDTEYGGPCKYLESIGFSNEEQDFLRFYLTVDPTAPKLEPHKPSMHVASEKSTTEYGAPEKSRFLSVPGADTKHAALPKISE